MEWTFKYNKTLDILEVDVKGELTPQELNSMAKENLAEIKRHGCSRCLLNYQKVSRKLSVAEMYDRPKELSEVGVGREYKIAILVPQSEYGEYAFLENVYKNRGYTLEVFTDREVAQKFLLGP